MKCFTSCFHIKKIITKKPCSNSSSSNKINSISPQALQDLLETRENGEAFVSINDSTKEEARHKIVNSINLFEESKDEEEEEKEELNKSNKKNLLETRENDEGILANQVSANCSDTLNNLQKHNEEEEEANEVSNSSVSSYISYPKNHRYLGFEDIDHEDEANNNDDGNEMIHEESSYESLFSLSIDDSTRKGNNHMPEIMCDEEVNSPLKPMLLGQFKNVDRLRFSRSSAFFECVQQQF